MTVPFFSYADAAGSTTSARCAVSVRNMSCTTTNAALRASAALQADSRRPPTARPDRRGEHLVQVHARLAGGLVAGQQFGHQAHVDRAARVRVVDQADVLHRNAERIAERDQLANVVALDRSRRRGSPARARPSACRAAIRRRPVRRPSDANAGRRVLVFAHRSRRHRVDVRLMMPVVGADLDSEQRMLLRQIGADDQHGLAFVQIADRRQRFDVLPLSASSSVATSPVR